MNTAESITEVIANSDDHVLLTLIYGPVDRLPEILDCVIANQVLTNYQLPKQVDSHIVELDKLKRDAKTTGSWSLQGMTRSLEHVQRYFSIDTPTSDIVAEVTSKPVAQETPRPSTLFADQFSYITSQSEKLGTTSPILHASIARAAEYALWQRISQRISWTIPRTGFLTFAVAVSAVLFKIPISSLLFWLMIAIQAILILTWLILTICVFRWARRVQNELKVQIALGEET